MSYPHVTQFETVDRRARQEAGMGRGTVQVRFETLRKRLRLRRRLAPQPC